MNAEHYLKEAYEQEIGLKMLEMAILETQILKSSEGACPQTSQATKFAPMVFVVPLSPYKIPRSPVITFR